MKRKRSLAVFLACLFCVLLPAGAGLSYAVPADTPAPTISGIEVMVEGNFTACFYIKAPANAGEVGLLYGDRPIAGSRQTDGRYRVLVPDLLCHEMAADVTVRPYAILGATDRIYGKKQPFSLAGYAYALLSDPSLPASSRALLVAMLNFGAACQMVNGDHTDDLPNAALSSAERIVPTRDYVSVKKQVPEEGKKYLALKFEMQMQVREDLSLLFTITEGVTSANRVRLEIDDDPTFATPDAYDFTSVDGAIQTTVKAYPLYELSNTVYIRVVTATGATCPLAYSVESYAAEHATSVSLSPVMKNLLHAMMAFSDAMRTYQTA